MNELPPEAMGPKMEALADERRRRFAWIMACGEDNGAQAARDAGFSDKSEGAKVRAHHMMHDPNVLDAIEEASRKVLRGLAPVAIRRARAILDDPEHPGHVRMIETLLDRTGFGGKTEHKVTVEHTLNMKELEEFAQRLAAEEGIDPRRLIGGRVAAEAPVIEGEVVEAEVSHGKDDVSAVG